MQKPQYKKYSLSKEQIRAVEECLERGNAVEVKIERSRPVVVEIRRKLLSCAKYASGNDREEIQRDHKEQS